MENTQRTRSYGCIGVARGSNSSVSSSIHEERLVRSYLYKGTYIKEAFMEEQIVAREVCFGAIFTYVIFGERRRASPNKKRERGWNLTLSLSLQ